MLTLSSKTRKHFLNFTSEAVKYLHSVFNVSVTLTLMTFIHFIRVLRVYQNTEPSSDLDLI